MVKIILVVEIFKESLKSVIIKINVGKVVKSVGLGMYKEIKIISTETESEITRKKSSIALGSGTIIIAKIETIKTTTVRSFALTKGSK